MKTFKFNTNEEKLNEGKKLVKENLGTFYTDGSFEVSGVKGNIKFHNDVLIINITGKPFLASWSMIEHKLNEYFN